MSRIRVLSSQLTMPTYITLVRLCVAPVILPFLCVFLLPFNNIVLNGFVLAVFVVFSLTDLLDGFLARQYNQESTLGKILDPIADKFLVCSSLIGLLAAGKIFFLWVIILIGRDLFMMGLRQIASQYQYDLPVSSWGKVRTTVLMTYIGCLIANPYQHMPFKQAFWWHSVELILLAASLLLTLWSAYTYYSVFLQKFIKQHLDQSPSL
jgi:CDP-diacylglycerol--glycerol-3-phosphate 3-phosphatidyltransferase